MATKIKRRRQTTEREPVKPHEVPAGVDQLLDRWYLEAAMNVSRRTFTKMVALGEFPPPDTYLRGSMARWRMSTYNAWAAEQSSKRTKERRPRDGRRVSA